MICWKLKLLFLILSTIMTYNTNIIYTVLLSIDTLIQNEHQYFTCLAGSQPISFRRQLKIRDRLLKRQSPSQLIEHQSEFFPSFCTFVVFSLQWYFSWRWSISPLYPSKLPDHPSTNSTRLSVYSGNLEQHLHTSRLPSFLSIFTESKKNVSICGFEMAVYW